MARRHDRQARDFGPGPSPQPTGISREAGAIAANDNRRPGPNYSSALPPDALAIVEPVPVAVNQAGRAQVGMWRLRFAERWHPRVDPLTDEPAGAIHSRRSSLAFPTSKRQSAIAGASASASSFGPRRIYTPRGPAWTAKHHPVCAAGRPVLMRCVVESSTARPLKELRNEYNRRKDAAWDVGLRCRRVEPRR